MKIFIDSRCDEITKAVARELGAKVVRDLECREPWRYKNEAVVLCGEEQRCPQAGCVLRIRNGVSGMRLGIERRNGGENGAFEEQVWCISRLVQGGRLAEMMGETCARKLIGRASVVAKEFVTVRLEQGSYVVVDLEGGISIDGEPASVAKLRELLGCAGENS